MGRYRSSKKHEGLATDILYTLLVSSPMITLMGGVIVISAVKSCSLKKENCMYTIINAKDGDIDRMDDAMDEKSKNVKYVYPHYEIVYQDDTSIIVFVYGKTPADRLLYADFVESNITFDENGVLYFSPDEITKDNYYAYIGNLSKENTSDDVQRKRK